MQGRHDGRRRALLGHAHGVPAAGVEVPDARNRRRHQTPTADDRSRPAGRRRLAVAAVALTALRTAFRRPLSILCGRAPYIITFLESSALVAADVTLVGSRFDQFAFRGCSSWHVLTVSDFSGVSRLQDRKSTRL